MSAPREQGHESTYTPLDAFRLDDGRVMVRLGIEGHRIPEEFVPVAEDYRQAALELQAEIRGALAWIDMGAKPSVAHSALRKSADKWLPVLEALEASSEPRP